MKKKVVTALLCGILAISSLTACGDAAETAGEATSTVEEMKESSEDSTAAEEAEKKAAEEAAAKESEEKAAQEAAAQEAEDEYEAGRICLYGLDGHEVDFEAAYNHFEKALELGKVEANFYLGVLYDWEGYPEQDYEKARTYYEAAGENPYAYISLGFLYYNGQGVDADKAKGKEYFDNAIALECMDGYYGLGDVATDEEDYAAAMDNYNMAAENGTEILYIESAMIGIGNLYQNGRGVAIDYAKAMEWFQKAADLGFADAMNNIGVLYANGLGVDQDSAKALEYYQKAAEQKPNNEVLICNIGIIYFGGEDYTNAMEWFQKAADLGSADASFLIGYMYVEGLGIEQDYTKAMEWYLKAADLGSVDAMNDIGYLYEEGLGVEQDSAKADEWYAKAEAAQ